GRDRRSLASLVCRHWTMRVILRDPPSGGWRLFERPRELIVARLVEEVLPALARVEEECRNGFYAAGFIAYEAAPAFDHALRVRDATSFPLLWFGVFERFHLLPEETVIADEDEAGADNDLERWTPDIDSAEYCRAFERVQQAIHAGETYQLNLTYRLRADAPVSPFKLFQHLVTVQPSDFAAYLHAGEWVICSASPELF